MKFLWWPLVIICLLLVPYSARAEGDPRSPRVVDCTPPTGPAFSDACKAYMKQHCEAVNACNLSYDSASCAMSLPDNSSVCSRSNADAGGPDFGGDDASRPSRPTPTPSPIPTPSPTPTPTPTPTPSPSPDTRPPNSADASSEVNACNSDTNAAATACDVSQANNFSSQVSGNQSGGSYGQINGAQQINNVVTSCSAAIDTCTNTCSDSLNSAQSKCSGDCGSSFNQQIAQINSTANRCSNLSSNLSRLQAAGNQALNGATQQQQQQNGNMNPSSTNTNNNNSTPQAVASPGGVDCTNPVNASQCSVQKTQTTAKDTSGTSSEMQESNGTSSNHTSGFNVGDPGAENQKAQFAENQRGNQSSAGANPYGQGASSSGFNFGGGNNNQNANQASNRTGALSGSNKTAADVLHGEAGRTGYSSNVSRSLASSGKGMRSSSFGSFSGSGGGGMKDMRGLDLKQYLPGGAKDGTRRLSGVNFAHPDIHGQNENLWTPVSNRFQVHCKLQLLYDCH